MLPITPLTAVLALGHAHFAQSAKLAMTRCYCISDTEVGWVAGYNLTTSNSAGSSGKYANSSSTVWSRAGTVPRDDTTHAAWCGQECNVARTECWGVPRK